MMPDWKTLFGGAKPPLVGLDISSAGVRLVELAEAGKEGIRVERCAVEPLPRGAITDGNIENLDQVQRAYMEPNGMISAFRKDAGEVDPTPKTPTT